MGKKQKLKIIKEKSQIFTPKTLIKEMLNMISDIDNLYQLKVLENSCGDGRILSEIVKLYINSCKKNSLDEEQIIYVLQNNIMAFEIDECLKSKCINALDQLVSKIGIYNVNWNIKCEDFLENEDEINVDLIIGNPPYIAYPNLDKETQDYLREKFESCEKGKFDYYYAFIEKSYYSLKPNGRLIYLVPSNFFKNVYAKKLRRIIIQDLVSINDYPDSAVFENALVSPSIIEVEKDSSSDYFCYVNKQKKKSKSRRVSKADIDDKWIFEKQSKNNKMRFGNYYKASICIATLSNDVFVLKKGQFDSDGRYYLIDKYRIESALLKKAVSPNGKKREVGQEYIIFPYYFNNESIRIRFSEEEIKNNYPEAYSYLKNNEKTLRKRQSDKNAQWFEYGRSQALDLMNSFPMILISSIISEKTKAYKLIDEIPYSGIFILPRNNSSIDKALAILNSDDFKNYINSVGVCLSGNSKRITPKDIEDYYFFGE